MFRKWFLVGALFAATTSGLAAQFPPRPPLPPAPASIEGTWFFRGDPRQPCVVRVVPSPFGPHLMFINEKGTPAAGYLTRDGREVVIPDWNLTGRYRGNTITWPNGDFWGR